MANIVCAWAALIANVALFVYWLYKILKYRRNPITGVLYCELSEFRTIARTHLDDADKYFLTDFIEQTPSELGLEPSSCTPPRDGWVGWMPWWKADKRYPKPRTPLSADPVIAAKTRADSSWDV